ncbi:MAG: hypothetical protein HY908_26790 [Myxococcales bacterium]|nr:hypothetical protein [Myxococcales bacterium]
MLRPLRPFAVVPALAVTVAALAGCPRESQQPQPGPYGYGAAQPYPPATTPYPPGTAPYPTGTYPYPTATAPYPTGTAPYPTAPYPTGTATAPQPTASGWPFPFPFPFPTGTATAPQPTNTAPAPTSPFPLPGPAPTAGGATAQPIDPNVASAATVPLMAVAQQEAAGMRETTPIVAANFQQGQTMDAPFQMMPGKCYTVISVGAGINEMDIKIVALQPIPGVQNPVLAQDNSQGSTAVLGGRGNCFKWSWPFGMNAKAVFTATVGQGIAAGRVYEK